MTPEELVKDENVDLMLGLAFFSGIKAMSEYPDNEDVQKIVEFLKENDDEIMRDGYVLNVVKGVIEALEL